MKGLAQYDKFPSNLFVIYHILLDGPLLFQKRPGYVTILTLVPCQVSGKLDLGLHVSQHG
jgi:hypothetical protein